LKVLPKSLRDGWVIRRRTVPVVPVLEGLRIPSTSQAEEHGRYGLLFFRPWTLVPDASSSSIAHFGDLGFGKGVSIFISFILFDWYDQYIQR